MRFVRVTLVVLAVAMGTAMLTAPLTSAAEMTKLTVQVNSAQTGKPVDRASVIVRFKHGIGVNLKKVQTNWETKTNQEGRVTIPAINQGQVTIQIIAADFQTFGDTYQLDQPNQTITIKLNRPQAQYSEDDKQHPPHE
jgi:5-hydroxyisourate hydrolase-like protein (transthyretin family)